MNFELDSIEIFHMISSKRLLKKDIFQIISQKNIFCLLKASKFKQHLINMFVYFDKDVYMLIIH